jgi:hypothetical protein
MSRELLNVQATRDSFLDAVYGAGLVSFGPEIAGWTNKGFQHDTLLEWNPRAAEFLPKTLRLNECASSQPGPWLAENFSKGFVAKPCVGHSSEGAGMITDAERLQEQWARLQEESWLIQERVGSSFGPGSGAEFRAHTFWHRVVPEATFSRWDVLWDDELFIEIEQAVQRFLDLFPSAMLQGHAWGLDVIRAAPERIKIVDLNTNRGERRKWSGDLVMPDVLGAYVRHLETFHEVEFAGEQGTKLRENLADPRKWIKKAGIESVRRHEELRQRSWRLKRYRGFEAASNVGPTN